MNNTPTIQTDANLPTKHGNENPIASLASDSTPLAVIRQDIAESSVMDVISAAYYACGRKPEAETLYSDAKSLRTKIVNDFRSLSLSEVKDALIGGVMSTRSDYVELSLRKYVTWLEDYMQSPKRKLVVEKRREILKAAALLPEVSETEKTARCKNLCISAFNDYQAKDRHFAIAPKTTIYDILNERGLLRLTPDRKRNIMARAKTALLKEYEERKNKAVALSESVQLKNDIAELMKVAQKPSNAVVAKCKELALLEYFDGLIEIGSDLEEEFESLNHYCDETNNR